MKQPYSYYCYRIYVSHRHRESQPGGIKILLPMIPIGIASLAVVGQPLSKQLYTAIWNTVKISFTSLKEVLYLLD